MAERKWVTVESKKMDAIDYDPISRTLYIRFHPTKEGKPVYAYANVEPPMFEKLMNSDSKGKFFNAEIGSKRDEFPFKRIDVEPVEEKQ